MGILIRSRHQIANVEISNRADRKPAILMRRMLKAGPSCATRMEIALDCNSRSMDRNLVFHFAGEIPYVFGLPAWTYINATEALGPDFRGLLPEWNLCPPFVKRVS
ncbi:hypothetical protein J7T55_004055 [Diaporthe amygdali]|uniref:uncharacterized protein n=1 Tax=Phomopsis amygdali TaxID=1214568 RepID=UPI0022FF40DE|nr:uncharacterized protein J7T55_004055 [Diaporthe amygdali]KAJ0115886.1 hypothetical protein J7T55_004055 [Diaporthe amygdali]